MDRAAIFGHQISRSALVLASNPTPVSVISLQ
jgi:hypothetical protein